MFENKVAVVTGGAKGIGKCICREFEKAGARVCTIDLEDNPYFVGDIADEAASCRFAEKVIAEYGHVDFLVNNAKPLFKGIDSCTWEEFNYALRVGVSAPFRLTQLFLPYFAEGASVVNISSSRDRMSQPFSESYTAAKGGNRCSDPCHGGEPFRESTGQLHLSRLDRHGFYRLSWS